jgi:hypothetical protein
MNSRWNSICQSVKCANACRRMSSPFSGRSSSHIADANRSDRKTGLGSAKASPSPFSLQIVAQKCADKEGEQHDKSKRDQFEIPPNPNKLPLGRFVLHGYRPILAHGAESN